MMSAEKVQEKAMQWNMVADIWEKVQADLMEPLVYLPDAFCLAILLLPLYWIIYRYRLRKKVSCCFILWKSTSWFLCTVYLVVLLNLAFFSREPGSRDGVDLYLFATWGSSAQSRAYVIENIIMLIPFGVLMPEAFEWMRKGQACVLGGFCFSVALETMQLCTGRGHCQLDDVLTNTLGTVLGWGGWCLIRYLYRRVIRKQM